MSSSICSKRISSWWSQYFWSWRAAECQAIFRSKMVVMVCADNRQYWELNLSWSDGSPPWSLDPSQRDRSIRCRGQIQEINEKNAQTKLLIVLHRQKDEDKRWRFSNISSKWTSLLTNTHYIRFKCILSKYLAYSGLNNNNSVWLGDIDHTFMAHPQSGMKASRIEFKFCSSEGSNLPSFLILSRREVWLPLRWAINLASNLDISEVTILSR